jgi:hypothetical protein
MRIATATLQGRLVPVHIEHGVLHAACGHRDRCDCNDIARADALALGIVDYDPEIGFVPAKAAA